MSCRFLPLIVLLNFLARGALGQQQGFVLDFAPVPFGEIPTEVRETDQIHLKLLNQEDGLEMPQDTCPELEGPFGNQATLDVEEDVSVPWKVRIVNVKDYYIKLGTPPSSVEIYLKFGAEASREDCNTFRPSIALTSPREKYGDSNTDPLVVLGCEYMAIEYTLSVNTACNVFGKIDEGDIEFTINSNTANFLRKGRYEFQPCASYMEMSGVTTVQFKPHDTTAGRFLEGDEAICPYCPPDDPECPCCHSKDAGDDDVDTDNIDGDIEQKLEEVMEQLQALQQDSHNNGPAPGGTSDQKKPSSVAIAAVSLSAIATALGLVNLGILLSRRQT